MRKPLPLKTRLKNNVTIDDNGCWRWKLKSRDNDGYVHLKIGSRTDGTRRNVLAHRLSYEVFKGPIPSGLTINHECNMRDCINPDHLTAMTMWENTLHSKTSPTAINARKTHCPKCNSEYEAYRGGRRCRPCYLSYLVEYNRKRNAK